MPSEETCTCGACDPCRAAACRAIENYARRMRSSRRWGRNAYVQSQIRMLKVMTGLMDEGEVEADLRRSEWGAAMQARQRHSP
jgi:hypothetical protein